MTREELVRFIDNHLDEILWGSLPSGNYLVVEPVKMDELSVLTILRAMRDGYITYRE